MITVTVNGGQDRRSRRAGGGGLSCHHNDPCCVRGCGQRRTVTVLGDSRRSTGPHVAPPPAVACQLASCRTTAKQPAPGGTGTVSRGASLFFFPTRTGPGGEPRYAITKGRRLGCQWPWPASADQLLSPPPRTRHVAACGRHDPTAGPHPPAALTTGSLRGMRVGRGGQRPPPGRRRAAPLSPNRLPGCPLPPPRRPPPSPLACRAAASTPWGAHSGRCCGRRARGVARRRHRAVPVGDGAAAAVPSRGLPRAARPSSPAHLYSNTGWCHHRCSGGGGGGGGSAAVGGRPRAVRVVAVIGERGMAVDAPPLSLHGRAPSRHTQAA